jgi:hypothetical protein
MPNINFPSSPTMSQSYTFNGSTWIYNGKAWVLNGTSGPAGVSGATGPQGATGPNYPAAILSYYSNYSMATSITPVIVKWDNIDYNTSGDIGLTFSTNQFINTTGSTLFLNVSVSIGWNGDSSGTGAYKNSYIQINGDTNKKYGNDTVLQPYSTLLYQNFNTNIFLNSGEYFEVYVLSSTTDKISTSLVSKIDISKLMSASNGAQGPQGPQGPGSGGGSSIPFLPVPEVKLISGVGIPIEWMRDDGNIGGTFESNKIPVVVANDFLDSDISTYQIFVEMVSYRRKKNKKSDSSRKSGFIVSPPFYPDGSALGSSHPVPWVVDVKGSSMWTRAGRHQILGGGSMNVDRPNHYQVNRHNQVIPVYEYLYNRFTRYRVKYRDSTGTTNDEAILIPISQKRAAGKNRPTNKFGYSPFYRPFYFAFRYVVWMPDANSGRGQIISGPLSKIIKMTHKEFPFQYLIKQSNDVGSPCVSLNPRYLGDTDKLQCFIENFPAT